nr:formin-like protein 14 [Aegilops tauschii subsp. strangulata]
MPRRLAGPLRLLPDALHRPSPFAFAVLRATSPPVFVLLHDRSSSASSRQPRLLPEPAAIPRLAPCEPPPPLLPFSAHRASPSCPAPDGHREPLPLLARLRASSCSPRPVPVLLLLGLPLCCARTSAPPQPPPARACCHGRARPAPHVPAPDAPAPRVAAPCS